MLGTEQNVLKMKSQLHNASLLITKTQLIESILPSLSADRLWITPFLIPMAQLIESTLPSLSADRLWITPLLIPKAQLIESDLPSLSADRVCHARRLRRVKKVDWPERQDTSVHLAIILVQKGSCRDSALLHYTGWGKSMDMANQPF